MSPEARQPVLVGLGELLRRPGKDDAELTEPATMMIQAIERAAQDSGAGRALIDRVGQVAVAPPAGWPDGSPGARVAELLGRPGVATARSSLQGGNGPQLLVNRMAARIADGELDAAIVCGAEIMQSVIHAGKHGLDLGWPVPDGARDGDEVLDAERDPATEAEVAAGMTVPATVYPLFEDALRARAGRTVAEQRAQGAALWSRFSAVAAGQPCAWSPHERTPEELATPSPDNRLVSLAYPKLLNANMVVDQSAALVLCAAGVAEELGIPRERWVYLYAGAEATEEWFVSERRELDRSPAIAACTRAALEHAGTTVAGLGPIDLYSCFPSAVQIAAAELGLPLDDPDRPLTCTGGLTFFGGPGNDYATHGIIAVARRLRDAPAGTVGLSTALGWYVTKHAAGVYGNAAPQRPYAALEPEVDRPVPVEVAPAGDHEGTAELRSILYGRDGKPETGTLMVALPDGRRALATTREPSVLVEMEHDDFPGSAVRVAPDRSFVVA